MRITRQRLIWTMRRAMTKRRLLAAARKYLPYQHRSIWNSSQRSPLPRRLAYFSNLLSMSSGGKNDGISAAHFPLPMLHVSGRSIPTCSIFLFLLILTPCLPSGDIYHIPFRPHCLSIPISFPSYFSFFLPAISLPGQILSNSLSLCQEQTPDRIHSFDPLSFSLSAPHLLVYLPSSLDDARLRPKLPPLTSLGAFLGYSRTLSVDMWGCISLAAAATKTERKYKFCNTTVTVTVQKSIIFIFVVNVHQTSSCQRCEKD